MGGALVAVLAMSAVLVSSASAGSVVLNLNKTNAEGESTGLLPIGSGFQIYPRAADILFTGADTRFECSTYTAYSLFSGTLVTNGSSKDLVSLTSWATPPCPVGSDTDTFGGFEISGFPFTLTLTPQGWLYEEGKAILSGDITVSFESSIPYPRLAGCTYHAARLRGTIGKLTIPPEIVSIYGGVEVSLAGLIRHTKASPPTCEPNLYASGIKGEIEVGSYEYIAAELAPGT